MDGGPPGRDSPTMSIEDTIRHSYEAMSRGDTAGYAAAFAEDATLVDPLFPDELRGREAIQAATEAMVKTFPDLSATLRSVIESGNRAAVETTYRGTNDGRLAMPGGELPPTGRQVTLDTCAFFEVGDDGRILYERTYFDVAGFLRQLGIGG